jgi:hypothetical protein
VSFPISVGEVLRDQAFLATLSGDARRAVRKGIREKESEPQHVHHVEWPGTPSGPRGPLGPPGTPTPALPANSQTSRPGRWESERQ